MVLLPVGVNPPNFQKRDGYREDKERKRESEKEREREREKERYKERERLPLPVGVNPQTFRAERDIEKER